MDRFSGLMAFIRTAELGSFVAAGRSLGLSASAVGKGVARLEHQLGVRLFQRSTRSLRLTDEGRVFQERCRRIIDELDDARATVSQSTETPRGKLRVTTMTVGYHFLLPILAAFLKRYPEIELDVDFNDQFVDLIEDGYDVALRGGALPDSRFRMRALPLVQVVLCASPAYLARHGYPGQPADLQGHCGIRFRFPSNGKLQDWPLPREPEVQTRTAFTCNNMQAVLGMTLSDMGIACMPDFLVRESLASGALCQVLAEHTNAPAPMSLIWPSSRHLSPKIRVFVDFVSERMFAREQALKASL